MQELDFSCDQSVTEAFAEIQKNLSEDLMAKVEREVSEYLNETLGIEADLQLDAQWYERTVKRIDYRAGYRYRTVITPKGTYRLKVPKARSTPLRFSVFNRYERLWRQVNDMLRDIFLAGCSTRRTGEVLECLLGTKVSAQTVSRAVKELTPLVERFHRRELEDRYRVLLLDGVTQKIRSGRGKAKIKYALVAYGITHDNHRELIDFMVTPYESEASWYGFLNRLYHRGLEGETLELIVSDGGAGLVKSLPYIYPHVRHQRCWAHKLRNVSDKVNKADQKRVLAGARRIYLAPHRKAAMKAFNRWANRWGELYPKAVRCVEKDLETLLTFYDFPKEMWENIRNTNLIERSFKEFRRRTRPIGCFNDVNSCERILYAIVVYLNAKWESKPLSNFAHKS
jgi:putative transposase